MKTNKARPTSGNAASVGGDPGPQICTLLGNRASDGGTCGRDKICMRKTKLATPPSIQLKANLVNSTAQHKEIVVHQTLNGTN